MSQLPASTCKGSVWQYCNYGYDKTKYSSFHDCLTKKTKSDCGKLEDSAKSNKIVGIAVVVLVIYLITKK